MLLVSGITLVVSPVRTIEVSNPAPVATITWESSVLSLLKEAGIDIEVAKNVIFCESRWKPDAVGDSGDSLGLWQINKVHSIGEDCLFDPVCSTKVAIKLIKENWRGWENWSCFRILYKNTAY